MGDGLKKVFAFIKHGQAEAPDPLTFRQREVLREAVVKDLAGGAHVHGRDLQSAKALARRELVTLRTEGRTVRMGGVSRRITHTYATATPAGKTVHEAIEERRRAELKAAIGIKP